MRMRLIACVGFVLVALGAVEPANGGRTWVFYTGEKYLQAPDVARALYVAGLSDAFNVLTDAGDLEAAWIVDCTMGKHSQELTRLFDAWLESHPDDRHKAAPRLFLGALKAACAN